MVESDVYDEFAEASPILLYHGIVANDKLKRNNQSLIISVTRRPLSGLESFWYQMNPVPDLNDTETRNRRQKNGVDLWRISEACVLIVHVIWHYVVR